MQKRNFVNTGYVRHVVFTAPKFGEKGSVPLDQTPSKEFNVDPCTGRPMSDVQRLCKLQSDFEMQALFASLPEFKSKFLPDSMSDADALKFVCPRLAQLPSELLEYRENLTKYQIAQAQLAEQKKAKVLREKQINDFFDKLNEKDLKE